MVNSFQFMLLFALIIYVSGALGLNWREDRDPRTNKLFKTWKTSGKRKSRTTAQDSRRFYYFAMNLKTVEEHNEKHLRAEESFRIDVNKYADLNYYNFAKLMLANYRKVPAFNRTENFEKLEKQPLRGSVPDHIDWRKHGWVTSVKEQFHFPSGYYPSGFAFAAAGALEGQLYNFTGKSIDLSAQQIIDCSLYFNYYLVSASEGLLTAVANSSMAEADYPYQARWQPCRSAKIAKNPLLKPRKVKTLMKNDEKHLKKAVALVGPVAVDIHVTNKFMLYHSGVFDAETDCPNKEVNHGLLIVGYGTDEKWGDYWILKNSWGLDWGENGYIRITRDSLFNCGLADFASFPMGQN